MPRKTKSSRKKTTPTAPVSFADWRGVPCFDFNMCLLLAHAPMDRAIDAFIETFGATCTKDIVGREIPDRPPAYLAYQFKGHPWTIFDQFLLARNTRWTTPEDARRFSKILCDKVLLFPISDTAGVYQYAMFDKGKMFERVHNVNERDHSKPYKLGFESPGRNVKPPPAGKLLAFIDQFMREQDILIPPFGTIAANQGSLVPGVNSRTRIDWRDEFNPQYIERADYLPLA